MYVLPDYLRLSYLTPRQIICLYPAVPKCSLSIQANVLVRAPIVSTVGLVLTIIGFLDHQPGVYMLLGIILSAVGDGLFLMSTRSKEIKSGAPVPAKSKVVLGGCRFLSCVVAIILLALRDPPLQTVSSLSTQLCYVQL